MFLNPIPVKWSKAWYPRRLWELPKSSESKPWLTFDDGPDPVTTPQVLGILDEFNTKAHFFCSGEQVEKYPELYRDILRAGHGVGNHGWSHLDGWKTSTRAYIQNTIACEKLITSNWFRPPYGRLSRIQERKLRQRGYQIAMWSIMAEDWKADLSGLECAQKVLTHLHSQSIVVWHTNKKSRERVGVGLRHLLTNSPLAFGLPNFMG